MTTSRASWALFAVWSCAGLAHADPAAYIAVSSPTVVLEHVEVIDGTGAAAQPNQNVTIAGGKIVAIGPGRDVPASDGIAVLHLRGSSVMPGIVGMHEHLFYLASPPDGPAMFVPMWFSAPRLYLANGVTTIRTAGSIAPATDLKLRRAIDAGTVPGPHMDVTGPYLDGGTTPNLQIPSLRDADDARRTVDYWADRGVTSFKAYAHITQDELRAAVNAAHRHRLKVTGHLCSVTYDEAIAAGIDNLEHGFFANTAHDPGKKPDTCSTSGGDDTLEHMLPDGADARRLIASLVQHHVAITSTLPNFASRVPTTDGLPLVPRAVLDAMSPAARDAYLFARNRPRAPGNLALLLRREMDLERAFVAAGGLLIAGADSVGVGGVIPGFGDHRELELLVEAGFTPVEAIRIATWNGAVYLGRQDRLGSIAAGKNADLVVVKGDPAAHIADIENVEVVFEDGVGYDPRKLLDSVKGHYGEY